MSWPDDPFTYNKIEVPTVVGLLRNILTQYPDNGQIIKELVQNAEDAGATKVEVVHVASALKYPEAHEVVHRFLQGPSLCLYNNAVFSDEDWHGIRKLSESIKKNNPLQVGQFGLGFKSVFHITDYVTIISGQQVLFMDPNEPEDKMCRSLPLQNLSEVLPEAASQRAFGNYLTSHHLTTGNFPATIFWFPLRQSPSKISDTVYTAEHVSHLFESFAVEANICLTFLKSLEEITIAKMNKQQVTVTHSMKLMSDNMNEVRNKREMFRQQLQQCQGSPNKALTCSYQVDLNTQVGDRTEKASMRILHYLPGILDDEWMKWGQKEKTKHIPLVGVAVPTTAPSEAKGQIFSFLPLPPDPTNHTHLPIQVNGAFILNQNRRQVKWKSLESKQEPDVAWNEELAVKVVSRAYTTLLQQLLKETQKETIDTPTWYSFLPDLTNTQGRWKQMAQKVWNDLLPFSIISSEVCGFMKVQDILTCNDLTSSNTPAVAKTVRQVLCSQSLPLATLPHHVLEALVMLGQQVNPVTPKHLRHTLKTCPGLDKKWNRLHLLCYAAKDEKFDELVGLPLLPLQSQTWGSFKGGGGGERVYLCTGQDSKALLGLEEQVASTQVTPPILKILQKVAVSGRTQLCQFKVKEHGPDLLNQSATYVQTHAPPKDKVIQWLTEVWRLLQHIQLHTIQHIPLVPTSAPPNAKSLTSLTSPLVVQEGVCKLSQAQVEVLGVVGVVVVPALPSYVKHIELQGFLCSSDSYGTTKALNKMASQKQHSHTATHFNGHTTKDNKEALHTLIDIHNMQLCLKNLLKKLNIFQAQDIHNGITDVCLERVNVIAPEMVNFPVSFPKTLLTPPRAQERTLAQALGGVQLSKNDLCVQTLRSCCGDDDITRLVTYILKDAQLAGSSSVLQELRNTRFVPNAAGSLCRPSELYDHDGQDRDALLGETQIPSDSFRQHYPLLRSLGLRKMQDMPSNDLVNLIKRLLNSPLSQANRIKKSAGLLRAINGRTDCPLVCQAVHGVPFVFGESSRPLDYPTNLEWATPPGLLRPQDVMSCQYSDVCGSAVAVVKCQDVPNVAQAFGWTTTLSCGTVVQHLHNIQTAYQVEEWSKYFSVVKKTYSQLGALLGDGAAQLDSLKAECCIFTEQGFKTPAEVYVWPGNEDLQVQPYLYPVPLELRESESLFVHLGCARQQTPSLLLAVLETISKRHQDGGGGDGEVERDLRVVVSVLERLQHHIPELSRPVLVPVRTEDNTLELAEVSHTAYTEAATHWIDSEELEVKVVHQCVSNQLAKALGVAPLSNFLSAGGEAVMDWGQREPLTTRLHNLLRQYRDGVSVLKELVQNADDAGATTVRLLYDERQNEHSRTLLLGSGMGQCQGPALWAYNDAQFSEQDFCNLREIGAGTKELQPTKIGKFGLGFCSVYNLTDVPSFVSGSSYVVFDPHMTHLDNCNNSPGTRYNFTHRRNSYMLRTLHGQFQPFRGVFGCDVQESGSFQGTLFRLPLRTPLQASTSKISNTCYSHKDVVQLLNMFSGVVGQLLLFTQHVSSISVCHLPASATDPTQMVELFRASRSQPLPVPGLASPAGGGAHQSLLERMAALFSHQRDTFKWSRGVLVERNTAEVRVRQSREAANLCGVEEGEWITTWVNSWHSGSGKSCSLAEAHKGKALPLSGVAVPVSRDSGGWQLQCLADLPSGFYREGHFHCFLPLPVKTFLPVQINGVLEVASDRTNLLTQTQDDRHTLSWNDTLLGDATVHAYLGLVEALRHLGLCERSVYHAMWPVVGCGGGPLVDGLTKSFYQTLEKEDLELFRCGRGDWHPLSLCLVLEESFLQVHQVGEVAFEFLDSYLYSSSEMRMVRLPKHIQAGFDQQLLAQHTITQEMFFQEYFIPHLSEEILSSEKRDQLIIHLLDSGHHYVKVLRGLACIPTQPHGTLKPPCQLINPGTRIAQMFCVEDKRFPLKNFLDPHTRSTALTRLGMNTHSLSEELVLERAMSVAGLALVCSECARHRILELLYYIATQEHSKQDRLAQELKSVSFLPVMLKPKSWNVGWHREYPMGEECPRCVSHRGATSKSFGPPLVLDCPSALCLPSFKPLVGSFHPLLEESLPSSAQDVLHKLGVTVKAFDLPLPSVVKQLGEFSTAPPDSNNVSLCHAIYEHLEDVITLITKNRILNNIDEIKKLREKKILITNHGFVEPKMFALHTESDCAPDLFSARTEGLDKYRCLMDVLGIKENFEFDVVMKVIQQKRETFTNQKLKDEDVSQVSRLLNVLFKVRDNELLPAQLLYLPDSQGYLRSTQDLCLDDGAELSSGQFLCLHPSISVSKDMCEWLGIKSKTRKRLSESSNRLRFGQKEPLTTRLRNILNEYPCDSGIMKEVLQNADDAGATEVTFYKDFRHLPDQKLFDPMWAPLQGPALIVFNNKGFTQQDLQSIQDLGNSSKMEDPATTGQYGIGFNAVYHLTDAPSFLTKGPLVPEGETLCMFDPHCWYDPSATQESPGVQFVNLNDLRHDHPDSFVGYLEEHFPQEGTMFRLPLRTTQDSLISKEILNKDHICKMLQEFEKEMPNCLLFLRNVRKISIKKVESNGTCKEEYCVEANVPERCDMPVSFRKHGDTHEGRNPCSVDMVRSSYTMKIHDTKGHSSRWAVTQQLGVQDKSSLPEIVEEAFRLKTLNLLPHGGVALLLEMDPQASDFVDLSNMFSTSCYLPLPVKSGLPFSINGHFTLNSSRRDLWTGRGDAKGLWNEWLMKELLVPAAIDAVEKFRNVLFPSEDDSYMTEQIYVKKVRRFHRVLPLAHSAGSEKWREFVRCFYERVRDEELDFFDSFVPETDPPPPPPPPSYGEYFSFHKAERPREIRKGQLVWHAYHASGDQFPVYFSINASQENKYRLQVIGDIFRRLGMKVSSEEMYGRLKTADPEFECPRLTPDTGLEFIKSWHQQVKDRCQPGVGREVTHTPFLKTDNVLTVLSYVISAEGFSSACVDNLPLLVTNDSVLGYFSVEKPVFLSYFCNLLSGFGKEFTLRSLVNVVDNKREQFKDVVKTFTPANLGERLPAALGPAWCAADAKLPQWDKPWLKKLWSFVVQYIEKEKMDWAQGKDYILGTIGDWAFFPVRETSGVFLIPIKNAWQVLDLYNHPKGSLFHKLPVPVPHSISSKDLFTTAQHTVHSFVQPSFDDKPYIPTQLKLAATLDDPKAVLQLLDFHRESVNWFLQVNGPREVVNMPTNDILEYLGKHCQTFSLCHNKIRSLQIFKDPSGQFFTLLDKKLVVLAKSLLKLDQLEHLCGELGLFIIPKPESDNLTKLYTFLEPNCLLEELELYTKIILPNITSLNEEQKMFYFKHLDKNLPRYEEENSWSEDQQRVIVALKSCPFIQLDGSLYTASHFFDPNNPVFAVMGMVNLPELWTGYVWHRMLTLAGMVVKVTADKFVECASSLSLRDENVLKKSKVLCEYLGDHYKDFQLKMSQILDIQFLVPKKSDERESLLPHHQTHSGLVAFSESANQKFADIIWSTKSLLPSYATELARKLQKQYGNKVNMDNPPAADIVAHIVKLCSSLQLTPDKSPQVVGKVMESIYEHLSQRTDDEFQSLKERDIPLIHIPHHTVFVSISLVVASLEEEILPYLYKAPVVYGKFFGVFKNLGVPDSATVNTYGQVLQMIHEGSQHKALHPQEAKKMVMALKGLVKNRFKLKDLCVPQLYLPARDETLRSSSEMFVADSNSLLLAVEKELREPVFVGFKPLKIDYDDPEFVKLLPKRLQPKLLSETCTQVLQLEEMVEVPSPLLLEIHELLQSQEFRIGVLRMINHYKVQSGRGLTKQDVKEITALLPTVTVKMVNAIRVNLTLYNNVVGQRQKTSFIEKSGEADQTTWTLYLAKNIPPRFVPSSLCGVYSRALRKWKAYEMSEFSDLFTCYGKPHDLHKYLDEKDIKPYSGETLSRSLYRHEVGSYLEERFLPFLDNGFSEFLVGEIVCMKKYLYENEIVNLQEEEEEEGEGDIYVIVEVVRLVEKHDTDGMRNTYEVNTSSATPCLITVKALQLYRFVRKEDDGLAEASPSQEPKTKEEICREIREQLRRIWQVEDEQERRHLLRRLQFRWHPDKNLDQVQLCTEVMQYMQNLVGRLERGEQIPDEEDPTTAPQATPSQAYAHFFRRPPRRYRNRNRNGNRYNRMPQDPPWRPRSDLQEAQRWRRQARTDLQTARTLVGESPSWAVFLSYQAAEKVLLAALYEKDMEFASRKVRDGPEERTLVDLALHLANPPAVQLANTLQGRTGGFLGPLYPTFEGCPQDRYTTRDAELVLSSTENLLDLLGGV